MIVSLCFAVMMKKLTEYVESCHLLVKPRETRLKAEGRGQKAEVRGRKK